MPQVVVGLDIGTSAVRAAELDFGGSRPTLVTYGQVGLPPGSLVDGEIRDGSSVVAAVKRLWESGEFSSTNVVVGIAGLRAITREIDLPSVPANEVDSAVRFQSEEVIPFPPNQTLLSSQVLSEFTSAEGDKMSRVLVAAAHTDLVNGVIGAVEKAGLKVEGVDLVSSALVRALVERGTLADDSADPASTEGAPEPSDRSEAVVSVGAGLTVIAVHRNGRPQFVRTVGSGGNAVTAAISAALGIPFIDAESFKRHIGSDDTQVRSAERAAEPAVRELIGEIQNSIQYFASLPDRVPVSRVIVTGGGVALPGFVSLLAAETRLPVAAVSPLAGLDVDKLGLSEEQAAEAGQVLAAPIGLALPERDKGVAKFNLLPPELKQKLRMGRIQQRTLLVCAAVLVLVALFGAWKFLQVRSEQNKVNGLNANLAVLNAQVPKYDVVVAANDAYTQGVARRAAVLNSAIDWPLVLNKLIAITPPGAEVQALAGTSQAASPVAGTSVPATTTTTTPGAVPSGTTTSAAIGTVQLAVTGPGPSLSISEAWINAISGSTVFANPVQGATVANPGGSISFPFTISITPAASLSKNASIK